jgi:hypothetical protein
MPALKRQEFVHLLNSGECDMRNKLPTDPIIDELHTIRRTLAAECNNDLQTIVQRAIKRQRLQASSSKTSKPVIPVKNLRVAQPHA